MQYLSRLVLGLMISFVLIELPVLKQEAYAGMISTGEIMTQMDRVAHEQNVAQFLGRDDVKLQLSKLGYSADEASRKLAGLSDKEVKKLSEDIQTATLGGDVGGILVVILLVILIIYFAKRL